MSATNPVHHVRRTAHDMAKSIMTRIFGTSLLSIILITGMITSCQGPRQEEEAAGISERTAMPEQEILKFLDTLFVYGQEHEMFNMPPGDGEFLRLCVAGSGVQRALEIGTSNGLSAIWIGLGLLESGGTLTTLEIDHEKAEEAKRNIRKVGMEDVIEVIEGDAFEVIPKLEGTFDFVHLDAWKEEYKRFFNTFNPKLERGGLIAAHNAVLMASYMQDYLDAVRADPEYITATVQTSNDGFALSYKRNSHSRDND
ncbi:MAG: O-methyltransferase [Gemmatimonadota bacterium]|nr:MAG: O-methyltransferase [Gemmatimonadota bacterium]